MKEIWDASDLQGQDNRKKHKQTWKDFDGSSLKAQKDLVFTF